MSSPNNSHPPRPVRIPSPCDNPARGLAGMAQGEGRRGLLLLPPLAEERKGAWRPLRDLSENVAGETWTVLRFDYFGTGESPGAFEDATWEDWLADANAAAAWLRARTDSLSVLAVRGAARLAAEAFANANALDAWLAWEPVTDLRAWRRDAVRRSRFRLGASAPADGLDVDGYVFAPGMAEAMDARTDLPARPAAKRGACLAVAPEGKASPRVAALAKAWEMESRGVAMMPFWLETDVVDAGALVEATRECLR